MVRNKRCPQGPKGKPVSLIAQRAARLHHDDACGDHEQYQDADDYGDECNSLNADRPSGFQSWKFYESARNV